MSNSQPIDKESLSELDNDSDNGYVTESDVENDKGLWKVGSRYYAIDQMDREFLQTAYFHALKKLGEHAEQILQSQKAIRKFLNKMQEIEDEAEDREIDEMIPVSPETALKQVLDPDYAPSTSNNQQNVNG